MPNLSQDTSSSSLIRLILMSISGGGKTSAIIPLAIPDIVKGWPGRKLYVLNFDGRGKFKEIALQQLQARLVGKKVTKITNEQHAAALANINFVDCFDPQSVIGFGGKEKLGKLTADAWATARRSLKEWESELNSESILVIDSFTWLCDAITAFTMSLSNRLNMTMEGYKDYAPAQAEIRNALAYLGGANCNVILTAHQASFNIKKTSETAETDPTTGLKVFKEEIVDSSMLPSSTGQSGRESIPSQFNHMLFLGTNSHGIREIRTTPGRGITPKTPFFALCKPSYDLDTGLVEYFKLGI